MNDFEKTAEKLGRDLYEFVNPELLQAYRNLILAIEHLDRDMATRAKTIFDE